METHTKKHILGFFGLAAVAAMTFVAYLIPTPDAAAESSTDVTYTVHVHEKASVEFADGLDGKTFNTSPVTVGAYYSDIIKISYYLSYTDKSGNYVSEQLIRQFCPAGENGVCPDEVSPTDFRASAVGATQDDDIEEFYITGLDQFNIDLDNYGGYGKYVLHVVVTTAQSSDEDYVTFYYSAGTAEPEGTDSNGNPIIDIEVTDENVEYAYIQVYDEDGNPMFVDENGNPTPIRVEIDSNGHIITSLPFDVYNIGNGKYRVEITFYDKDGNVISVTNMDLNYDGADQRLAAPDTGFLGIGNLNISNPSYLFFGGATFVAVAGSGAYLVRRNKARK